MFQDLLGSELATAFSSSHLQTIARAALAGTASSESSAGQNWAVLAAVVSTGKPYPGLVPELEVAIQRAHVDTGGRDIGSTLIGLRALASLAGLSSSAREEVLTRVRTQLLDIAASVRARRVTGASSDASPDERFLPLMVDVAYQIARTRRSNEEHAVSEFSEITIELTRRLPPLRALVRPLIEQLAEKLPSSQAQHLWQLLLLLRSLS